MRAQGCPQQRRTVQLGLQGRLRLRQLLQDALRPLHDLDGLEPRRLLVVVAAREGALAVHLVACAHPRARDLDTMSRATS